MPPAARVTDMHVCPMVTGVVPHVGGPILPPCAPTVLIGFLPAARVTDMLTCVGPPDIIVKGSAGVFINFLPAARMGDNTAHGGVIILGEPTVIVGEIGSPSPGAGGAGAIVAGLVAAGAPAAATSGSYQALLSKASAPSTNASQGTSQQKSQAHGIKEWLKEHPGTVKAVGDVVIVGTAISGIFDGGVSEAAVPEEIVAEKALLSGSEKVVAESVSLAEKPIAEGPELQKIIDQLYKPTDSLPGGTAGAVRNEIATQQPTNGLWHSIKATERAAQLEKGIQNGKFSGTDLELAKSIAQDLRNALGGK